MAPDGERDPYEAKQHQSEGLVGFSLSFDHARVSKSIPLCSLWPRSIAIIGEEEIQEKSEIICHELTGVNEGSLFSVWRFFNPIITKTFKMYLLVQTRTHFPPYPSLLGLFPFQTKEQIYLFCVVIYVPLTIKKKKDYYFTSRWLFNDTHSLKNMENENR